MVVNVPVMKKPVKPRAVEGWMDSSIELRKGVGELLTDKWRQEWEIEEEKDDLLEVVIDDWKKRVNKPVEVKTECGFSF